MAYAASTKEEQKQYNSALGELEKYPGGKLSPSNFSKLFGPIAREENRKSGIPASVTLAQAALETGWGGSTIGSAKNLFGIKGTGPAGTTVVSTRECEGGNSFYIKAGFCKYNTWLESIEDHTRVLKLPYYKNAFNYSNDPDQFAREVKKGGYATDPNYAKILIQIMNSYDLKSWNLTSGNAAESAQNNESGAATTAQTSTPATANSNVSVGSKVKITGSKYATGQSVPNWVKQNTYTVSKISGQKALISEIVSWVNLSDLAVQGTAPAQATNNQTSQKQDAEKPSQTTSNAEVSKPADKKTEVTALEKLLSSNPGVKTNQQLINLFYSMGGGNFNGAAAVATQYGVNINTLCKNRNGAISNTQKPAGNTNQTDSGTAWSWPSTATKITSYFGPRKSFTCTNGNSTGSYHRGVDIAGGGTATIKAAKPGTISVQGYDAGGYGNWAIIDHGNGFKTRYAHMRAVTAQNGTYLNAGDKVGDEGATGNVTGPHLHFEVRVNDEAKDPLNYIK